MIVKDRPYRTIWLGEDKKCVYIIDQRFLPFKFVIEKIATVHQMTRAIKEMHLRGAPLIGAAAAYGVYLAVREALQKGYNDDFLAQAFSALKDSRPTAVNLSWALDLQQSELKQAQSMAEKCGRALQVAEMIADQDVKRCKAIGENGLALIREKSRQKGNKLVQVLTHCNAGALACIDYGTATAPIYQAHAQGISLHVWVDETRPRNQGALTAWELAGQGVPHTVICDNTGGLLMHRGQVDLVIVGTDRVAANGDVANKIGTYLKALAAYDNKIPFYVALPTPSIDWNLKSGQEIPIEERSPEEVLNAGGILGNKFRQIRLFAPGSKALNYAFDITPARLVTAFITEKGVYKSDELKKHLERQVK
jgi:methylthioribose-1-phosphate isomerase